MFRWIRRIKRHKRNKKLLMFAEALYKASITSQLGIFVHPLIFEIIRFRLHTFGEMCSNIMPSDMVKLTEIIVDMEWINNLKRI